MKLKDKLTTEEWGQILLNKFKPFYEILLYSYGEFEVRQPGTLPYEGWIIRNTPYLELAQYKYDHLKVDLPLINSITTKSTVENTGTATGTETQTGTTNTKFDETSSSVDKNTGESSTSDIGTQAYMKESSLIDSTGNNTKTNTGNQVNENSKNDTKENNNITNTNQDVINVSDLYELNLHRKTFFNRLEDDFCDTFIISMW